MLRPESARTLPWTERGRVRTLDQFRAWVTYQRDANADSAFNAAVPGDIYDDAVFDKEHKYVKRVDKRDSGSVDLDMFYTVTGALTDDGKDYEDMLYDAWGRLIQVESKSGDVVVTYRRNGMDQIITRHDDADEGGLPPDGGDEVYHQAIDEGGHMLAIYRGSDANPKDQVYFHVYGLNGSPSAKCDGTVTVIMVEADKSDDWWEAADSSLETRTYLLTNHRGDVSAAISDAGLLRERVKYSAYGVPSLIMRTDWDADGDVDSGTGAGTDQDKFQTDYYAGSPPARADYNFDGSIDPDDLGDYINDKAGDQGGAYGYRVLSAPGVANRKGFAGAEHDRVMGHSLAMHDYRHVRLDLGLLSHSGSNATAVLASHGATVPLCDGFEPQPPPSTIPEIDCLVTRWNTPPSVEYCNFYDPCDSYSGSNARCFCNCAGDNHASNYIRGCLQCMYSRKIHPHRAHMLCYEGAENYHSWDYWTLGPRLSICFLRCSAHQFLACP